MSNVTRTVLAALAMLFAVPLSGGGLANAAEAVPGPVLVAPGQPVVPQIHMFDCDGGTGSFGCGPGFHWRDGWRGMACYPC